ncbi:DUF4148 domain-containing protein [Polaromonas sp.]
MFFPESGKSAVTREQVRADLAAARANGQAASLTSNS